MRPIYARAITEEERQTLRGELKSGNGVVVRRSQVILMSADEGLKAQVVAERVGYSDESVRQVIQQFNQIGLKAIYPKVYGRHDDQRAFKDAAREGLKTLVHQSPRSFGCESSMWTLQLLAEVSYQEGLTDRLVHSDTVGETLHQLGVYWKKAKRHIQSPDVHYKRKKKRRDWLKEQAQKQADWWLLEEDESWFHRFIQPHAYGWSDSLHPIKLMQQVFKRSTPDKAVACFGALCQESQEILMDFAQGYPNSEQMWWVIVRLLRQAKHLGKKVMVLIWDNAPWHCSKRIREWIRTYNQQAKQVGEVRLLVHWLPIRSPWLNPIEPYWGHAKRRVCEPSGKLSIAELRRRIRVQFKALTLDDLLQPVDPM